VAGWVGLLWELEEVLNWDDVVDGGTVLDVLVALDVIDVVVVVQGGRLTE
jgi:hypothetical protein